MADAGGLLGNAATAMFVIHAMGTTRGLTAHFSPSGGLAPAPPPPPPQLSLKKGGGSEEEHLRQLLVNSVHSIVPVDPDQEPGCLSSQAMVGLRSGGSPSGSVPVRLYSPLAPVSLVTPLQLSQFQAELRDYPDHSAAAYVLTGLRDGFRIGFDASSVSLLSASSNMRSALEHPSVVDDYLQVEVSCGRVAGPFATPPVPGLHVSRFGVIPKNYQPGKWRLILDLSSLEGHSVNDGIPKTPFSVQYITVDTLIEGIMARGQGTLMAKFDVASAYRNVAIHPGDRPLLGMMWRGKYYVDMVLPFGLRSAPYIFTAIADTVQWMATHNHGVDFLQHYLDDFLTLGPPASPVCYNNLQTCIQLCTKLGLPLHPDKLEGPSTCLSILGIELDSSTLQARLPPQKRERIIALLGTWAGKRFCRRRELESLIGHLHHACKVAPQGRTFLRRMINLLCTFRRDDHPIRLNQEFQRDLTWWHELFLSWDGLSFFQMPQWAPLPDFQVSSDASGSLGYGAIFNTQWFVGTWSASQESLSIAYKELFPIVVAAHLWGPQWTSRRVEFLCDNMSVVAVLSSGTSREGNLMILLRYLALLAVRHSFSFTASSVRGKANPVADALSRFQFQRFRLLAPLAEQSPTPIPQGLLTALQVT